MQNRKCKMQNAKLNFIGPPSSFLLHPFPSVFLSRFCLIALTFGFAVGSGRLQAENGKRFLVDHRMAPGQAAKLLMQAHPENYNCPQFVKVILPQKGTVTFYDGLSRSPVPVEAPAQATMTVGNVFRFKLSQMTDYPDVELYPTIELLDRLHAPLGRAEDFPIPIPITVEEIDSALNDRMVTKVIYLEQPDFADPEPDLANRVSEFPPAVNLLEAADRLGRPMAILRIGGRLPDPRNPEEFYGQGVVRVLRPRKSEQLAEKPGIVKLK